MVSSEILNYTFNWGRATWFQSTKSTASATLIIQSIISRALDSGNIALMASIDLSAAFDLGNIIG